MHSAKQKIIQFYRHFKLENFYYFLVLLIIVAILFLATFALFRPVTPDQYLQVRQLAQQAYYPSTQDMASQLIQKKKMTRGHYLKLMRAYHVEKNQARELPPLADDTVR